MVSAQNSDLQRVWRLVQELSNQLKTNQVETERLKRCVELSPYTTLSFGHSGSDESSNTTGQPKDKEHLQSLIHSYSVLTDENSLLRSENDELSQLLAEFEIGLSRTMDQVREHQHQVTQSTVTLHRNYLSQIEEERQRNERLSREAVELQEQMHSLSQLVRNALREHSNVESEAVIEALRLENEALRLALGESKIDLEG